MPTTRVGHCGSSPKPATAKRREYGPLRCSVQGQSKYPYDPRRTEQLMQDAGFMKDRDGFFADAGGRFHTDILTNAGPSMSARRPLWRTRGSGPASTSPRRSRAARRHGIPQPDTRFLAWPPAAVGSASGRDSARRLELARTGGPVRTGEVGRTRSTIASTHHSKTRWTVQSGPARWFRCSRS